MTLSMSMRTYRRLQAIILALTGMFLLSKIWGGTLFWYINERYTTLILFAALGLIGLAAVVMPRLQPKQNDHDTHHNHEHHHYGHTHDHDEHVHSQPSLLGLFIVALPVLLGLLVPARPLGASAVANKQVNTVAAPVTAESGIAPTQIEILSTDRNILDWVVAFNYTQDPQSYEGQLADVTGFTYHDNRLPAGQFLVGRFTLTCCAADSSAVALVVEAPEGVTFENNTWVRVQGPIFLTTLDGDDIPIIKAESVEPEPEPNNPYLYP